MNPAISIRELHKAYRTGNVITPVLKGVSLDIAAGELFFITGPSGCGKTTLVSVLCGTLLADSGEIEVLNHNLRRMTESQLTQFRANHVGFVFQQFNLIPSLTITENVAIPLRLQHRSPSSARAAAAEMLNRVGLGAKLNDRPATLSGGQQQRVAIARALVHQPALVVCDEPTSALDSETGREIMNLLTPNAGDSTRTVIVVTHDPRIQHRAHRIASMEDGLIHQSLHPQADH